MQGDAIGVVLNDVRHIHHRSAHVRGHGSRLDDVDPDAVRAEDRPEGLPEHADGALGPAVGDLLGRPHMGGDRADHDDRAAMALRDHLARSLGADDPRAPHVGLEELVEGLERRPVPGHERVDGRVRHDVVQPSAAFGHLGPPWRSRPPGRACRPRPGRRRRQPRGPAEASRSGHPWVAGSLPRAHPLTRDEQRWPVRSRWSRPSPGRPCPRNRRSIQALLPNRRRRRRPAPRRVEVGASIHSIIHDEHRVRVPAQASMPIARANAMASQRSGDRC